jgi:hypothetical protein
VLDQCRQACLALEARPEGGIAAERGRHEFERHTAPERGFARAVHNPHPAPPGHVLDLITGDHVAGAQRKVL